MILFLLFCALEALAASLILYALFRLWCCIFDFDKEEKNMARIMKTEHMGEVYELTTGILTAFDYELEEEELSRICEELSKRLNGIPCLWSDAGNVIFNFLVLMYGDYGTSPRSGWIEDRDAYAAISYALEDFHETIIKEDTQNER